MGACATTTDDSWVPKLSMSTPMRTSRLSTGMPAASRDETKAGFTSRGWHSCGGKWLVRDQGDEKVQEKKMWYESDRSERQDECLSTPEFQCELCKNSKCHLEGSTGRKRSVRRYFWDEYSHSPLAAREGGDVHEAVAQ